MRIDIPAADQWGQTSDRYRAALAAREPAFQDPALQVQVYAGYAHALYEATQGLARLFSHKKTIALLEPVEPAMETIAVAFAEEGFTILRVKPGEDPSAILTPALTDLIFVLYSEDDPVTGRLNDSSKIEATLKDKRVFRLALSHAAFRERPIARPMPFEARVLSLSGERALIIGGERFRVNPVIATRLPWPSSEVEAALSVIEPEALAHARASVETFETNPPKGFQAYFALGEPRVFDRAVIWSPSLDGSAVIDEMRAGLGVERVLVDTTSPCRWSDPRFQEWLLSRGEKPEVVRGLVLIDATLIEDGMRARIEKAAETCRSLGEG